MAETRVVNVKTEGYDVYIGRGTPFGNPQHIGIHGTRAEVIDHYRQYFAFKLKTDPNFKGQVLALKGKRLGCSCKPSACHGDVIKEYLDNEPHTEGS